VQLEETSMTTTEELVKDPESFRSGLRGWLAEGNVDQWRGFHAPTSAESIKGNAALVAALYQSGWGRYGWPQEAGGLGGSPLHLAILYDELSRRGIPVPEQYGVLQVLGPMVVHFAPALATEYLGAFLRGEEWWGQGFSEPEAGSDMASLRTRAQREGKYFRISGSKLWTSHGVGAKRMVVLARTGTPESRHRGLSMFLVDSDTPGLEIRPIALANGREDLAEVFYSDVLVHESRLIGEENKGWGCAMYLMQFERGLWAWLRSTVLLTSLGSLAAELENGQESRRVLGEVLLDLSTLRARSARTVRGLAAGATVGPDASADKLLLGAAETSVLDAARTLLGTRFLVGEGDAVSRWREEWWFSRTTTIYGGSAEVQRQILADQVLKLPKEAGR
jgi:alkylation response protein AidB-like acyl-CoA dehydrogenase